MTREARSIQGRLVWRLSLLFVAVLLGAGLSVSLRYRMDDSEAGNSLVRDHVDQVRDGLSVGSDGRLRLGIAGDTSFDYVVRDNSGAILFASPGAGRMRLVPVPSDWDEGFYRDDDPAGGRSLLGSYARVSTPAGEVVVQVAETDTSAELEARGLFSELAGEVVPILLPFLLATLVVGIFTIRRGLAPLSHIAGYAAAITPRSTNLRLPDRGLPRELIPLVAAVNSTLDRLDEGFRVQREFTADAAHELRTPLAILAAHLDTLEDKATAAALREDVDRMSRLVGQLLCVAQLEALAVAPNDVADLHAISVDVAASLAPLAMRKSRAVAVVGETKPALVTGNADALHQAVRNLVENALQHTPPNTTVEVMVTDEPAVHVTDRGPGVPQLDRQSMFQRFWRASRSIGQGAGLGLAIVGRIVEAHGGTLSVDDAPGGGARFSLRLPAPAR